jgi:hypothetical protein
MLGRELSNTELCFMRSAIRRSHKKSLLGLTTGTIGLQQLFIDGELVFYQDSSINFIDGFIQL